MSLTPYHAKYFAHDLTRRGSAGLDRLSMSLFDAAVDLNPHQIEAALFALQSPLSKGVILADEVGLGKTIEAGIVLCQSWAERQRRLVVIAPASIRKQWALELAEKFNLPAVVLDAKAYRDTLRQGRAPLSEKAVIVMSFNFANKIRDELKAIAWDLVVIDEAHKLRNAYRPSNKVGQGIRWATEDRRKLLLTATPLQNSLVELYGLSTLIDEHLFGDVNSFRAQYATAGASLEPLRQRLATFCKRTLRNQVTEYIRYTERRPITRPFRPTDDEHALYEAVSAFLQRENSYALPHRQRHLTALILRKLLASSSQAIAATLDTLRQRLETLRDQQVASDPEFTESLIEGEEIDDELLDEILNEDADEERTPPDATIVRQQLKEEIEILTRLATWAHGIGIDTKTRTLLKALELGFETLTSLAAARKAIIFTESRRTQDHLKSFLESNGYAGEVVVFNGTNGGPEATAIYERWAAENRATGRATGSRAIDIRTALIEYFRDKASILLATEAAAEGVNLQFCSLVVNYDLPWNPQRIEQRIGRCHRYGQKHDVVVINFLNERNAADQRVLELLSEKFKLFDGVFGASDEVLGSIESGVDFEKRILAIYQQCRTPAEIDNAFKKLQQEMDEQIRTRLDDTRRSLLEHFDEDVHERLRIKLADTTAQLDRISRRFAIDSFEGSNLVLVDEGHRGASSGEDGAWMKARNALCEKGFSFEYSATFQQAVAGNVRLSDQYAKNILFNYSYRYFYGDGFGKDYQILNLDDGTQHNHLELYLVACLLTFFQQQRLHREHGPAFRPFNIEKPLWIFVGGSVTKTLASRDASDIVEILKFLARYVANDADSIGRIDRVLNHGLLTSAGKNLFAGRFSYLGIAASGIPGPVTE